MVVNIFFLRPLDDQKTAVSCFCLFHLALIILLLLQEQRNGRSALHLAVDQQNLSLVQLLLKKGADPNLLTAGGHTPYHLTYGRDNDDIRKELFSLTNPDLRELPDSESEESEEEDEESEEEVCVESFSCCFFF